MRRFGIALVIVGMLCAFSAGRAGAAGDQAEKLALDSAQSWLALVDAGKYGESWDAAASLFKGAVVKANWQQMVAGVRSPLGKVLSRKLKAKQFATSLPGAPDGQYVVIQFDTVFEHKSTAIETVIPTLDKDGAWRVSGYFIK